MQVVHTCGRGLSVFGGGNGGLVSMFERVTESLRSILLAAMESSVCHSHQMHEPSLPPLLAFEPSSSCSVPALGGFMLMISKIVVSSLIFCVKNAWLECNLEV